MMSTIFTVMNSDKEIIGVIEDYLSANWAERYSERGEFEMDLPFAYLNSILLIEGNIILAPFTTKCMVVGDVNPIKEEDGNKIRVKGYSGEDTLRWRVTTDIFNVNGSLLNAVKSLINDNVISPTNTARTIDNYVLDTAMDSDPDINTLTITNQYEISYVYDVVKLICEAKKIGFSVDIDTSSRNFVFRLYSGKDRSYDQVVNPYVVFSDSYDNVLSSSYFISAVEYLNVCLVAVGDENAPTVEFVADGGLPEGYFRRETFVSDYSVEPLETGIIQQKGLDALVPIFGVFDGELDIDGNFKLGVDFALGDVVQCIFDGMNTKARMVEIVRSYGEDGISVFASFDFNLD